MERKKRSFGGGVGGEICGAETAEDGGDGYDGAATFTEHVREDSAESVEVGDGVRAESPYLQSVHKMLLWQGTGDVLLNFFRG